MKWFTAGFFFFFGKAQFQTGAIVVNNKNGEIRMYFSSMCVWSQCWEPIKALTPRCSGEILETINKRPL